jgi:chromosomal replication initiation ATPase DnaA
MNRRIRNRTYGGVKGRQGDLPPILMRRLTGMSNNAIGEKVGLKFSAVSKAGVNIEKQLKEDRGLKREVEEIVSKFEV